jgi:diguanylate cyclase (GGDEF)-like protein/PAS domain S-box-containing protein
VGPWQDAHDPDPGTLDDKRERRVHLDQETAGDVTDRDRAEDSLRQQLTDEIVADAGVGIVVYDRDLRYVLFNPFMEALTGRTAAEVIGSRAGDLFTQARAFGIEELLGKALGGQTVNSPDVPVHVEATGRDAWVIATYAPRRSPLGEIVGVVGVVRDITERKRTEDALRESEERYRRLIELSPDAIAIHSGGRLAYCNRAGARLLGYDGPDEVTGRSVMEFVHPDSRPMVAERMRQLLTEGGVSEGRSLPFVQEKFLRRDGSVLHAEVGAVPFTLNDQPAVQVVIRDMTQQQRDQKLQAALYRLAQLEGTAESAVELYRGIHETLADLLDARCFTIVMQDPRSDLLTFPYFVDDGGLPTPVPRKPGKWLAERVLRSGEALLVDMDTRIRLIESGQLEPAPRAVRDWIGAPLKRGDQTFGVICVWSCRAETRYGTAERDLLAFVAHQIATALDRRQAEDALKESEARFRTLTDTAPCAIFMYQGARIVYANAFAEALTGYPRDQLVGRDFWDTVHPDFRELVRERGLARQDHADLPGSYEFKIVRKDGQERWVQFSASSIDLGGKAAALGTAFDVTERKQAEEQIRTLAYHDALTGLPNRLLYADRLAQAVAQAHRLGHRVGVLFLDLDRFKVINDSLGHSRGDLLLKEVALRLLSCVREGDTVARLGGDEFTLILPGVQQAQGAARVAEKILEAMRQPFDLAGRELYVTASIGISLYPDDGRDIEGLLKFADTAMYRAKDQGRDAYQLYTAGMTETAVERLAAESSFRRAVAQKELVVYYQPLCDIASGHVRAVEALLRWQSPDRGLVGPSEFIGLAEVTGLIVPIGGWVLRTACAQAVEWHRHGHQGLSLAVNLSARQFLQPDLVAHVKSALLETGMPASLLEVEITETSAMQNAEVTIATLRELKELGVRVAIDDFGVGHSSLGYLKRLPIDTLKIDQSFVRDITTDPDDAAIATAVIALAHTLKLTVVAEGVETPEQLAFLRDRHCDRMQGHLLSVPLPAPKCLAFLDRWESDLEPLVAPPSV